MYTAMPSRRLAAARPVGMALGTPRPRRRSVAPSKAISPAARDRPMIAVVGIENAKPENFLWPLPSPTLSQRRNPNANMRMPSTPPTIDKRRSRLVVGDSCLDVAVEPVVPIELIDLLLVVVAAERFGCAWPRYPRDRCGNIVRPVERLGDVGRRWTVLADR